MSETFPSAAPDLPSGGFHADGRVVDAGRGWNWIVEGFGLFRRQPGMWILVAILPGIVFVLLSSVPVVGSLANALLLPIVAAGLMRGCKDLAQGRMLEIGHLLGGFKQKTGDLVMVGVFNLIGWVIIAIAVFAVIGGGGLFMGIMRGGAVGASMSVTSMMIAMLVVAVLSVPLYMATWFAPVLIVLHDVAPLAALKASFFACLGNWMPFLVYSVVMLVFGIIAAIPLGLGYLVLVPVLIASIYTSYRDIFRAGQEA